MLYPMDTSAAVTRLEEHLPLRTRQRALPAEVAAEHRRILHAFAHDGQPPSDVSIVTLQRLSTDDLVVVDANGCIEGAYPFTLADTGHVLRINDFWVRAMCSLDAIAVAPVFGLRVEVTSQCAVSGRAIHIRQDAGTVLDADPEDLRVGVRWQRPQGCAARTTCRDMVFLDGPESAAAWDDTGSAGIFSLGEAVAFGRGFFGPLVSGTTPNQARPDASNRLTN